MSSNQSGKGSRPRKVDPKKWAENWDRIFRKKIKSKPKKDK